MHLFFIPPHFTHTHTHYYLSVLHAFTAQEEGFLSPLYRLTEGE